MTTILDRHWKEIALAAVFVVGWLLTTAGVSSLVGSTAYDRGMIDVPVLERAVWFLSVGVLCISLGGWKMLYQLVSSGLYVLDKAGSAAETKPPSNA